MKTISELNSKIWYRFLKVIFVLAFIVVSLITVFIVYDSNKSKWVNDYIVTCNFGDKTTFAAWNEKSILLTDYDLRNYISDIPDYKKEAIQKACGITQQDLNNLFDSITQGIDKEQKLFDVKKANVEIGNILKAILFSLLSLVPVIIIFEIIKRAFYYIVLGSLRPPKNS
jgi:hypothetical protein